MPQESIVTVRGKKNPGRHSPPGAKTLLFPLPCDYQVCVEEWQPPPELFGVHRFVLLT